MKQYRVYEFDNRDSAQMYEYLEARIEALKVRIEQLEAENNALRMGAITSDRLPIYAA
jgi:HEAT repeat protein